MAQTEEDHIRIIKILSEAETGLSDQIPVHRSYRRAFRRSSCRCNYLDIRMIQKYPEQFSSCISGTSGNRDSDPVTLHVHLQNNKFSADSL